MSKYIILSAPSGSGKSTLASYLLDNIKSLSFSVSSTTRNIRKNEIHGIDYYFISKDKFNNHIKNGEFIEWEQVYNDDFKGTLKNEINRLLDNGKNIVFDVDVVGGLNLKKYFGKDSLSIFIDVPSLKDLELRLNKRGTDSDNKIKERLEKAKVEVSQKDKFDVIIMNSDFKKASKDILDVVMKFILA
tara:strand:- start:642 stop:1205 length:564 start_codon:yes stop_codon:yes gene_type:complete